jgi:phage antirepressor YoqD-like protein
MALTQMQIIQSLGEAMSWFERELQWGVPPTELRHLSGRIGELYTALIMNGQMATEVNQQGYDVVSSNGERISVKTTAMMGSSGHISFNPNTLNKVDRVVILWINTEEMQIEILLNEPTIKAVDLMRKINSSGKAVISLSKLKLPPVTRSNIPVIKVAKYEMFEIEELENGTITVKCNGDIVTPSKPTLRELTLKFNMSLLNGNGNPFNTRQLGSLLIKAINS